MVFLFVYDVCAWLLEIISKVGFIVGVDPVGKLIYGYLSPLYVIVEASVMEE